MDRCQQSSGFVKTKFEGSTLTTDHQVREDDPPPTERSLGMIVTALIVIGAMATVAVLATR